MYFRAKYQHNLYFCMFWLKHSMDTFGVDEILLFVTMVLFNVRVPGTVGVHVRWNRQNDSMILNSKAIRTVEYGCQRPKIVLGYFAP